MECHPVKKLPPAISVIIPAYNEAGVINEALESLRKLKGGMDLEVLVVDGHPSGTTIGVVSDPFAKKITAPMGRAVQMNAGAERASGNILLFLHADTCLPFLAVPRILRAMNRPQTAVGAFDLSIQNAGPGLRLIARAASVRSRITKIPYGDQAFFMKRSVFFALGGFSPIPLMEDVDFMRRVKKEKMGICILKSRVSTSPRRWNKEGMIRCTLRNWLLVTLYYLGVQPDRLARFYK